LLESAVGSDPLRTGLQLFKEGRLKDAVLQLARAIEEKETSERWNDWATAQLACGRPVEAEYGYRRALELDSENAQAAANLGVLLMGQGLTEEAVTFLERSAEALDDVQRAKIESLLLECSQGKTLPSLFALQGTAFQSPQIAESFPCLREPAKAACFESSAIEGTLVPAASSPIQALVMRDSARDAAPATVHEAPVTLSESSRYIVERAFVYRHLPFPFQGRVLEVGCQQCQTLLELTCLGFEVWGVGPHPPPSGLPQGCYLQANLKDKLFVADCFDVVIACSTTKQINPKTHGYQHYDVQADAEVLQEICRILKPDGRLILTTLFGRCATGGLGWVYDRTSLLNLLTSAGFEIEVEAYWKQTGDYWRSSSCEEAEQVDSLTAGSGALAGIVARCASRAKADTPVSAGLA